MEKSIYYNNSHNLRQINDSNLSSCCDLCTQTLGCTVFTFYNYNRSCFLKYSDQGDHLIADCISGHVLDPLPPSEFPWYNTSISLIQRASKLVAAMTTKEKISQLTSNSPAIDRLRLRDFQWWSEGLHGIGWAELATVFPQSIGLAASFDPELLIDIGRIIANEARGKFNDHLAKVNHSSNFYGLSFYTPNINIFRDPRWGRGQETYGEDPVLSATLGSSFIKSMQKDPNISKYSELILTAKHFHAYNLEGNTPIGGKDQQYRLKFDANVSTTDLLQTYLPAWEKIINTSGISSIMCAYNSVNGYPNCAHPNLKKYLRDVFNFSGFIVSDEGAIEFMVSEHHYVQNMTYAAAIALNAGVDCNLGDIYNPYLLDALYQGLVTMGTVDKSLNRLFQSRIQLGEFDPSISVPFNKLNLNVVDTKANRFVALKAAQESIVLLKNNNNLLPLDVSKTGSIRHVTVIGPNANRVRTLLGNYNGCQKGPNAANLTDACVLITPLQGIKNRFGDHITIEFEEGCDIDSQDKSRFASAIKAAKNADVVIVVLGLITCQENGVMCQEAEARDRVILGLPGVQEDLLRSIANLSIPTILVLMNGAPISTVWAAESSTISSIIELWYPGERGGEALANAIVGDYSPAGRLPITIPMSLDDLPYYLSMEMALPPGRTYRYSTRTPLYAFGYGLSYTHFEYSELKIEPSHIKLHSPTEFPSFKIYVSLQNNGIHSSDEVVQVYASLDVKERVKGNKSIPIKELKTFERVRNIKSKEERQIEFSLSLRTFRLVDETSTFGVIPGKYIISVGGSAPGSKGAYVFEEDNIIYGSLVIEKLYET